MTHVQSRKCDICDLPALFVYGSVHRCRKHKDAAYQNARKVRAQTDRKYAAIRDHDLTLMARDSKSQGLGNRPWKIAPFDEAYHDKDATPATRWHSKGEKRK